MTEHIDPKRFEKVELRKCYNAGKIRNWHSLSIGEFLSRIWSNYGPPNEVGFEGFSYCFQDTETGLVLSVYSAGSGPAFGGEDRLWVDGKYHLSKDLEERFEGVIKAFEQVLANSKLVDCEIEFGTDFGAYRAGARNGVPFEEPIDADDAHKSPTQTDK